MLGFGLGMLALSVTRTFSTQSRCVAVSAAGDPCGHQLDGWVAAVEVAEREPAGRHEVDERDRLGGAVAATDLTREQVVGDVLAGGGQGPVRVQVLAEMKLGRRGLDDTLLHARAGEADRGREGEIGRVERGHAQFARHQVERATGDALALREGALRGERLQLGLREGTDGSHRHERQRRGGQHLHRRNATSRSASYANLHFAAVFHLYPWLRILPTFRRWNPLKW